MSEVINLRAYTSPTNAPTLVLIDLQQANVDALRPLGGELDHAVANCRAALRCARTGGLPVAFARLMPQRHLAALGSPYAQWIDGISPTRADMIFDRDKPSCYASAEFPDVIDKGNRHFVLAGFSGEAACLVTAIEAFHRGHRITFLADASVSRPLGECNASATHNIVTELIGRYGAVSSTAAWIAECNRATAVSVRR